MVLHDSAFVASSLLRVVAGIFPRAEILRAASLADAHRQLGGAPVGLLITGLFAMDGDIFEFLASPGRHPEHVRRTLVVVPDCRPWPLHLLERQGVAGVFDARHDDLSGLERAVQQIAGGGRYRSPGLPELLHGKSHPCGDLVRMLTPREALVLAVIGDGSDDATAAELLGVKDSAVHSIRRNLHHKLGVQDRAGLIRAAVHYGYVRFTDSGVVRPGFSLLSSPRIIGTRSTGSAAAPR